MIVDFHCHAGTSERLTTPWTTGARLDRYLPRARRCGIGLTVVCPIFPDDSRRANREVAAIMRQPSRPRLVGFGWVSAGRDAGSVEEVVGEAVRLGLRGIKVHGHDRPPSREVCEAARRHRLPVLVDVAGRAYEVELFATEYPDVRFIVAHLGSFADDWRAHLALADQLARLPNVYADTSGVRRFDHLLDALRRAGPSKLVFGSDGPWLHPAVELAKVRALRLSPRDEAAVLGGNALRLLGGGSARRGPVVRARAGAQSPDPKKPQPAWVQGTWAI